MTDAFVYDAIRTPRGRGKKSGSLHEVKPVTLVTGLLEEIQKRNPTLDPHGIDDLVLGCVSPVGDQGADIAKTAALAAGLPDTVAGVQLNRFCASGLEAVFTASDVAVDVPAPDGVSCSELMRLDVLEHVAGEAIGPQR